MVTEHAEVAGGSEKQRGEGRKKGRERKRNG